MDTRRVYLFTDEESKFLLQKHHQYCKVLATKKSERFKSKKDVWDQISLDIQAKFKKFISAKQCATRMDTIQKRGKRKSKNFNKKKIRGGHDHIGKQYNLIDQDTENTSHSIIEDGDGDEYEQNSNGETSNSQDYVYESHHHPYVNLSYDQDDIEPVTVEPELISAPNCFYTINYTEPRRPVTPPDHAINQLSIISSVGLSRRPNILTPPVSTSSVSSNNEISSTRLAATTSSAPATSASATNPDRGEISFLKKSLESEREIVRTQQIQISHYESYIEILLQRIKDLDQTRCNVNEGSNSTEIKQEQT